MKTPSPLVFDRRQRIKIATPCYDFTLTEYYHNSLRACCQQPLASFRQKDGTVTTDSVIAGRFSLPNDSHIDRARNVIANLWMEEDDNDWLLWIDADIEFQPQDIARLFIHAQRGHKFVCGLYAMKTLVPTFVANVLPGAKPDPESGLVEVWHAGTGFMMLHRDVFLKLREHPKVQPYKCANNTPWAGKKFWSYFTSGVHGQKDPQSGLQDWQSEDWMLCELWRELGGKVFADTEIKLRHLGRLLYPPTVDELVEAVRALRRNNHPALPAEKI